MVRAPSALILLIFALGVAALVAGLRGLALQRDTIALFGVALAVPLFSAVGTLSEGGRR